MKNTIIIGTLFLAALALAGCSKEKPATMEASALPSSSPTAAVAATPVPTPSPTMVPSASPSPAPSKAPDVKQEPVATVKPQESVAASATATPTPKPTPTPVETAAPTPKPSASVAPSPSATPKPAAATDNSKVEALFKENCMACHGTNLEGDFGPNLTKVGTRLSKDQIVTQITKGGSQMPGYEKSLDSAAIETLAAWLAAKK